MSSWSVELTPRAERVPRQVNDLEYAYTLRAEAEAARRGEIKTRRLDEVAASLGLDD